MKRLTLVLTSLALALCSMGVYADTYGSYRSDSPGQYPEHGWLDRPYKVQYQSHSDGATDWFTISFPDDFDPDQSYPVWLKFCPYYGSRSHLTGPSHAWNYCDNNDVIVIGCNERGIGDHWFGDNENLDATLRANVVGDVFEILNQLFDLFNITYVAASGPSMGGYASLKVTSLLPPEYVGAVVASCPALWFRSWVQTGSDAIQASVASGHFTDKYVLIMHGTSDTTVPVSHSRTLTASVPDSTWWQLHEVQNGGHSEYFAIFDYDNYGYPYDEQYGQSSQVPDIWDQIDNWEAAHPEVANTVLQPLPGWSGTTEWYFPQDIVAVRADKGPTVNQPPVANAGPDQVVTDWDSTGAEDVSLDGSSSVDTDGAITSYDWTLGGSPIASGATPTVSLSLGANVITLTVTDDEGATDTDTVTITVGAPDLTAPDPISDLTGTPGNGHADLTWTASTSGDVVGHNIYVDGQLQSAIGNVTSYQVSGMDNGTLYTLGVSAQDASSNESSIVTVDVTPVGPPPGSIVTSVFQKGVSPDVGFTNMLDSTMRSLTGHTFGMQALGKDPAINLRYADVEGSLCMWYDVSSIPADATIESASLKLWHSASEFDTAGNLLVYRIHDPSGTGMWVENNDSSSYTQLAKGCSRYKRSGVPWISPDGRVTSVINDTYKVTVSHATRATEWLTADVTADIQFFVTNSAGNLGWMIRTESDNTLRGNTYMSDNSDSSKRPILEVVYSTAGSGPSNVAPTAVLAADTTGGDAPLNVSFVSSGSSDSDGTITSYDWDFGDGNNSTVANPSHTYTATGLYTATLTVTDNDGATDADSTLITVSEPPLVNQPPVLDPIGDKVIVVDNLLAFSVSASDPDLDPLTYQAQSLPSGATFVSNSFAWTPTAVDTGVYTVTFVVSDDQLATDSEAIQITVNSGVDTTPPNPVTGLLGTPGDQSASLTWTASSSPDAMGYNLYIDGSLDGPLGNVTSTIVPGLVNGVTYTLGISALDASANESSVVTVDVTPAEPPASSTYTSVFQKGVSPDVGYTNMLDSTIRSLTGHTFGLQSLGKDPAIDLRYADIEGSLCMWFDVESIPSYATVESATLKIWHSASEFDGSGNLLVYRIDDPDGTGMWVENNDSSSYTESSQGCSRYKRPSVAWSGSDGRVTSVINDSNKQAVAHAAGVSEWLSVDVSGDIQAFVANAADNLGWMIRAQSDNTLRGSTYMSDNSEAAKRPILEVVYTAGPPPNQPPTAVAAATPTTGLDPLTVDFDASGSTDSDGVIVSYDWDFGDGNSSTLASPSHEYPLVGFYTSVVTVTDDDGDTDSDSILITVNSTNGPPNQAPTLDAVGDKTVTAGALISFSVSGTDPDLDPLTYSAQNLPSGASFTTDTFSWTPDAAATGVYSVTFTVRDDELAEDSETINITVLPWDQPGTTTNGQIIPALSEILAACAYLAPGDIPEDTFEPPANAIYVATDGDDSNTGLSIDQPFQLIGKAIDYANNNPGTPYTIYLRGGTYYYKTYSVGQVIGRGNLYITAYNDEEVVVRPFYWPNNPSSWSDCRGFIVRGSGQNITFDNLTIEGWQIAIDLGSQVSSDPLRQIAIKNIDALNFSRRGAGSLAIFLQTETLTSDVYGAGKAIFDDPDAAHYQIEDLILENIEVHGTDLTVNVGDENDANVKGMRISDFRLVNPPDGGSGSSANDGFAVVNSYRVLIDHCTIDNVQDDGIDCKSYNVAVVNTIVRGTTRNAVKFWRTGEIINSIVYDCTIINDGAIIIGDGPCRIVNSILMKKSNGYAGTFAYSHSSSHSATFDVINSIFADLSHSFYVVNNNLSSKNSLYYDMPDRLFSGGVGSIDDVAELNARSDSSGNISAPPAFVDAVGGDFEPVAGSPLVNAGTSSGVLLPTFDFFGRPRVAGAEVDIGPIEYNDQIDSDGDGHTDEQEAIAGTNPHNPLDNLWLGCLSDESGLQWSSKAGRLYDIEMTTQLGSPWQPLAGQQDIAGTDGLLSITNIDFDSEIYFRIKVRQP